MNKPSFSFFPFFFLFLFLLFLIISLFFFLSSSQEKTISFLKNLSSFLYSSFFSQKQPQTLTQIEQDQQQIITKQSLINAIHKAALAYWKQRVEIKVGDEIFYGYSGSQTLIDPLHPSLICPSLQDCPQEGYRICDPDDSECLSSYDPTKYDPTNPDTFPTCTTAQIAQDIGRCLPDRYYASDWGWLREPHIFHEHEDSPGHPGVAYGFLRAYQATKDKFLKRVAKALGDTLLDAQKALGCGGWGQDMGPIGFDRNPNSPTFKHYVDFNTWKVYNPWAGRGNVDESGTDLDNICSFDGASWIPGLYLLRLYQVLKDEGDPDADKYLQGAKDLADAIVAFKDVYDQEGNPGDDTGYNPGNGGKPFYPYGIGGIPQMWPYDRVKEQLIPIGGPGGTMRGAYYPYAVMITLNDFAMGNALMFLIEFWKEAKDNPQLQSEEQTYLEAIRLNIDYLIYVFRHNANNGTTYDENGRGGFALQYWINDGSDISSRPTWARRYELPGFSISTHIIDGVLLKWWQLEDNDAEINLVNPNTNQTILGPENRKKAIEDVLTKYYLYYKYDVPKANERPYCEILENTLGEGCCCGNPEYDPDNIFSYIWWKYYNFDPNIKDEQGNSLLNTFVGTKKGGWVAYYGEEALRDTVLGRGLTYSLEHRINAILKENDDGEYVDLNTTHYTFELDPDLRLLFKNYWEPNIGRAKDAFSIFDDATGLFKVGGIPFIREEINGKEYQWIDNFYRFQAQMSFLVWGLEHIQEIIVDDDIPDDQQLAVTDSDGDGYNNSEDPDPYDSRSLPGYPRYSTFDGETTEFIFYCNPSQDANCDQYHSLQYVKNPILNKEGIAKLEFQGTINFLDEPNLDENLSLEPNQITINTKELPNLAQIPLTITFYNVNLQNPQIVCSNPSHCPSISSSNYDRTNNIFTLTLNSGFPSNKQNFSLSLQEFPSCNPGDTKPCDNQSGVCQGAEQTCSPQRTWPGCTIGTYQQHSLHYEHPRERTCNDGLDNDCDGKTDLEDSDCHCPSARPPHSYQSLHSYFSQLSSSLPSFISQNPSNYHPQSSRFQTEIEDDHTPSHRKKIKRIKKQDDNNPIIEFEDTNPLYLKDFLILNPQTHCPQPLNLDNILSIDETNHRILLNIPSQDTQYQHLREVLSNKPAIITFHNITFSSPLIKKDGQLCTPPQCQIIEYNKQTHTLKVRVQGFSEYEVINVRK